MDLSRVSTQDSEQEFNIALYIPNRTLSRMQNQYQMTESELLRLGQSCFQFEFHFYCQQNRIAYDDQYLHIIFENREVQQLCKEVAQSQSDQGKSQPRQRLTKRAIEEVIQMQKLKRYFKTLQEKDKSQNVSRMAPNIQYSKDSGPRENTKNQDQNMERMYFYNQNVKADELEMSPQKYPSLRHSLKKKGIIVTTVSPEKPKKSPKKPLTLS